MLSGDTACAQDHSYVLAGRIADATSRSFQSDRHRNNFINEVRPVIEKHLEEYFFKNRVAAPDPEPKPQIETSSYAYSDHQDLSRDLRNALEEGCKLEAITESAHEGQSYYTMFLSRVKPT
jgi:DNA polymerase sigma